MEMPVFIVSGMNRPISRCGKLIFVCNWRHFAALLRRAPDIIVPRFNAGYFPFSPPMLAHETLAQLKTQLDFQTAAEPVGNLTLGRGRLRGNPVHMAIVENKIASGAIGVNECDKLASMFKVVAAKNIPLVMYLDSAGVKVSEGLPVLGAFRQLYRAALAMAESRAPTAVVCGANCFGAASLLASLAGARYYSRNSRLAMSGPAILAQTAGASVLDEAFQAISLASMGAQGRIKLSLGNMALSPASVTGISPAVVSSSERHVELGARLAQIGNGGGVTPPEKISRKDLDKLYPQGYVLHEQAGVLMGDATHEGSPVAIAGLIGGRLLGAVRAWTLADLIRKKHRAPPKTLHLLVDCDSHATTLEDERIMLSAYIANLASALYALGLAGTRIETTVLGKIGGGVYVALCAPAAQVNLLYGAEIQLLPGKAIASILGDSGSQKYDFKEYQEAFVAEQEFKLGLV